MKAQTYREKVEDFRRHIGMFLGEEPTYDTVTAFICGMDYGSFSSRDDRMLAGFEDWLRAEFRVQSPVYFGGYISDIFDMQTGDSEDGRSEQDRIDFLFDVLLKFLSER
jgi:hypothetical protein